MKLVPGFLENQAYREFLIQLKKAIEEDLGQYDDLASSSVFEEEASEAEIIARQDGVISGIDLLGPIFHGFSGAMKVDTRVFNGQKVYKDQVITRIEGDTRAILKSERIALNFLGFLSGIATKTDQFVKAAKNKVQIIDTRKTIPGYRYLSKQAVGHGGGANHRYGLWDLAMLKDNHIDAAGGISKAVAKVRNKYGRDVGIEVECRNLEEVKEAMQEDINLIMLDNMSPEESKAASKLLQTEGLLAPFWMTNKKSVIKGPINIVKEKGVFLEASGDMTLERIPAYVNCGIHFISVGELTHSSPNFNFSLRIIQEKT